MRPCYRRKVESLDDAAVVDFAGLCSTYLEHTSLAIELRGKVIGLHGFAHLRFIAEGGYP